MKIIYKTRDGKEYTDRSKVPIGEFYVEVPQGASHIETIHSDQLADMLNAAKSAYFGLLENKNKSTFDKDLLKLAELAMKNVLKKMAKV